MSTRVRISCVGTLLGLSAILAGCSSLNVNTDFDPTAISRVGSFQSYAWLPHPAGGDTRANNSLVEGRLMRAVDAALQAKGYRLVQSNPDFLVGWHAGLEDRVDVQRINSYYGYRWSRWGRGGGVWTSDTYVTEYTQGTLILDIVDADANELVWRGAGEGKVNLDSTPQERERRIQEAVDKILEDFPPGG